MTFDIVIPIYNVQDYLDKCLSSIRKQTYKEYRALLIDDGSTDGSTEIARKYADSDDRFLYFRKENGGLSDARNYGIERTESDYVLFIDSDDYIENDTLEYLYRELKREPADVLEFNGWMVEEDGNKDVLNKHYIDSGVTKAGKEYFADNVKIGCLYSAVWLKCVDLRLFSNGNLRFLGGILHEDELWTPQLMLSAARIRYIDVKLYNYVQRKGSIMHQDKKDQNIKDAKNVFYMLEDLYNKIKLPKTQQSILKSYLCRKMIGVCQMNDNLATYEDRKFIKRNAQDIKSKVQCMLFLICPELLPMVARVVKKVVRYEQ